MTTRYRLAFYGRKINALGGISSFQVVDVDAESEEEARLKAYETHEHILHGGLDGIKVKKLD